jgi:signal transduction histidine kinase
VVAEFRALGASVLGLWRRTTLTETAAMAIDEITRFNEAIDEAVAVSVDRYSSDLATFLGVVGHDLRSPLVAIQGSATLLKLPAAPEKNRAEAVSRIPSQCALRAPATLRRRATKPIAAKPASISA